MIRKVAVVTGASHGISGERLFNLDTWGNQPGKLEMMASRVPAGRMGRPEEIAEAIVFRATTEGSYIHDHDPVVDGYYY